MLFWTNLWFPGAPTFKLYPNMQNVTFPVPATWHCGHCQILQLNCVEGEDITMHVWSSLDNVSVRGVSLCHGIPSQRLNSVQPKFIFIDQRFSLPANMAALRAPVASSSSKQRTPSASVCRMIGCQSQGCGEQAGGLWLLSHSSVQCTLLGPNFLLRSVNPTYSLCKSGHKFFYTIQPGLSVVGTGNDWVVSAYPLSKQSPVLGWKLEKAFIYQKPIQKSFCLSEQCGCTTNYWEL